jgi:hypothetical protein
VARKAGETNAINRVMKTHGLPGLDESGAVMALARMVEDHQHFMELLRACDPELRRDMYEAMRPHLRFLARPLDHYISIAKEYASAAELPVMDEEGFLHPYSMPTVATVELPVIQLYTHCSKCTKEGIFLGVSKADAIYTMRSAGWAYDESALQSHICPDCLEEVN